MTEEIKNLLTSDEHSANILNSKPIGIGFVDGNLTLIRKS